MTATITELDKLISLADTIPCDIDDCEAEATHRIVYKPCRCSYPICTLHADRFKTRGEQRIRWWHCDLCLQNLGFGVGAYFAKVLPL